MFHLRVSALSPSSRSYCHSAALVHTWYWSKRAVSSFKYIRAAVVPAMPATLPYINFFRLENCVFLAFLINKLMCNGVPQRCVKTERISCRHPSPLCVCEMNNIFSIVRSKIKKRHDVDARNNRRLCGDKKCNEFLYKMILNSQSPGSSLSSSPSPPEPSTLTQTGRVPIHWPLLQNNRFDSAFSSAWYS